MDLRQPEGSRITRLMRSGKPVEENDRFTLAMNNYRATGAGDFNFFTECKRVKEIQTEISELILNYLRERELVEIPDTKPYTVILPDRTTA